MATVEVGLNVMGNARVGKSTIVNLLAGTHFDARRSVEAVTTELQQTEVMVNGGKTKIVIFNSPGLKDIDEKDTTERNIKATRDAFKKCPNCIMAFVFKDKNGSVATEDVSSFIALNESYNIQEQSLLFIVNQWEGPDPKLENSLTLKLRKLTEKPNVKVVFIPVIHEGDQKEADHVQRMLFFAIAQMKAAQHVENADHPLRLEKDARQIADLEAKVKAFDTQIAQKDAAWEKQCAEIGEQLNEQKKVYYQLEGRLQQAQEQLKNASENNNNNNKGAGGWWNFATAALGSLIPAAIFSLV